ncbi:MAG: hypothetical protein ACI8ZM_000664 [Crocinitomix sp.]|jgi:uncharacterized protein (DUF1499 family)
MTQNKTPLKPCPNSPNCVSTVETKARKRMNPLHFKGDQEASKAKLKEIILIIEGASLIVEDSTYLLFEFSTSVGKYIDDVAFYFEQSTQLIHFRSASRKGYGDFGANKRRMKKISKLWENT